MRHAEFPILDRTRGGVVDARQTGRLEKSPRERLGLEDCGGDVCAAREFSGLPDFYLWVWEYSVRVYGEGGVDVARAVGIDPGLGIGGGARVICVEASEL